MNASFQNACRCDNCPGAGCNCGCQSARLAAPTAAACECPSRCGFAGAEQCCVCR